MHWGDPMIHTITELRNAFARRAFPVTGITHSLFSDHRNTIYAHLAFSDVRPYDAVICSSQACAKALRRILEISQIQSGPEKGTVPRPFSAQLPVIPLGVEMEAHGGFGKSEARRKLGLPPDHAIILCLARFAPITKMDLHPCLLALQRLIRENGHERILLLAAGSVDKSDVYFEVMVSRIKALGLTNHVLMKADFPAEEKGLLLAAADVFLLLRQPAGELRNRSGRSDAGRPALCFEQLERLPRTRSRWRNGIPDSDVFVRSRRDFRSADIYSSGRELLHGASDRRGYLANDANIVSAPAR